jgi:GTP cyclohydrolase III
MHKDQMMNSAENDEAPIEEKDTKHTSASLNLAINDALRTADARGITPEIRNSFQGKAKVMWNTAKDTGQSPAETVNQAISAARAEAEAKKDAKKDKEKEAERRDSEKQLKIKAKQDSDDKQVSSPTTVKAESIEDFNLILQKLSGIK